MPLPAGVRALGGESNTFRSQRLYLCPVGFETENGEASVASTCQMDGSWTRQPPICSGMCTISTGMGATTIVLYKIMFIGKNWAAPSTPPKKLFEKTNTEQKRPCIAYPSLLYSSLSIL